MFRKGSTLLAVCSLAAAGTLSAQQKPATASLSPAQQRAMVDQYCVGCHNAKLKSGGLALENLDTTKIGESAETWEKVIRKLRSGMMPPLGARRPDKAAYENLTVSLENAIDRAEASKPFLAPPGVHRVNRAEYANMMKDLLGIPIDPAQYLPNDDGAAGFDNVAGSLAISPALAEGVMSAASRISRIALGHELSTDQKRYINPNDLSQERRVEGLPFGTRGGMVVNNYFPADGEYEFGWSPTRSLTGEVFGANRKGEKVVILLDGQRIKLFEFDKLPAGVPIDHNEFRVPVKAGLHAVGVTFLSTTDVPIDDLNRHSIRSVLDSNPVPGFTFSGQIAQVTINGPFDGKRPTDTPSRRKILICAPANAGDEVPCAKKILGNLARQAFRRQVTESDMEDLLTLYQAGRNKGDFEDGIERALQGILADAEFMFRGESDPAGVKPGQAYRISDFELASRLSFFLWSTAPDAELLGLASQNKLHDTKVLEQQVRRMLADARSHTLVTNFAGQWLQLRNLAASSPITQYYPDFDDNLRQSFRTETEMLFESVMREDRNVVDLLNADYTFINERLARHYGMPNIYGTQFRRIQLNGNLEMRRGLLGQGSIQLITAVADRTSPVQRGKWVLMNILGVVPPEPPPNVPALRASGKTNNGQEVPLDVQMRERMEEHRQNPVCASCHMKMDPIGFAMEAFDAVGAYRTSEFGKTLDTSGSLADGVKFSDINGLRTQLLNYSPQFVRMVAEKLMIYAIGRGTEFGDMPVIRSIVRDAGRNNNRFSSLVMGVVKSAPFQMNVKETESVASNQAARDSAERRN